MKTFDLSYGTWKQIVLANGFTPYFLPDGANTHKGDAWAGTNAFVYTCRIVDDAWSDFEATFPAASRVDVSRKDDAVAQIVSGLQHVPGVPLTSDGKPIHLMNLFPGGVSVVYAGMGDDIGSGTRWGGQSFQVDQQGVGDNFIEWQFLEWIYLGGGHMASKNGKIGDHVSYKVTAPATAGTPNGSGSGAYDKQTVAPGVNIFVPNADATGAWDLDLAKTLNPNVGFTEVVPVPVVDAAGRGIGFFDWDPDTEEVSLNAAQQGGYHLYDVPVDLSRFVVEMPLVKDSDLPLTVPAVKVKRLLPHWRHRVDVHRSGIGKLDVVFHLYMARRNTA